MTTGHSYPALRAYDRRLAGMLADFECVGELLLVGMAMARCVDLGDPPWQDGSMPMKVIADAVYGRWRLPTPLLGTPHVGDRGSFNPRRRIRDVFFADRRRYSPDVDGDRGWHAVTCGRPMVRREGLCGRRASEQRRLTDPATGQQRWVGVCSQANHEAWFADLLTRHAAELKANPAPVPPANTGGVLERHLPEIDWWQVWQHVDPTWTPPPEGRAFERPTLRLLITDEPAEPVEGDRPALTVHEGGWR